MDKPVYMSKTIWAGVAIAVIGIFQFYGVNLPYELIFTLLSGVGVVGVRQAIAANK